MVAKEAGPARLLFTVPIVMSLCSSMAVSSVGMSHHDQLRGAVWLGEVLMTGLALYDLGPFPMAVDDSSANSRIQGELYMVSTLILEQLDRFEGVPRLYQRHRRGLNDGRSAWVYLGCTQQVRHAAIIVSGCWQRTTVQLQRKPLSTNQ